MRPKDRTLGVANLTLLEAMFDALTDCPFFVKNADLRYVAANPAMARLCGVRRAADLRGRRASDIFPAALARRYEALDLQVLANGRAQTNRLDLSLGAGATPTWLLFSRLPLRDANGTLVGIVATARRLKPVSGELPTSHRLAKVVERLQTRFVEPLHLIKLAALAGVSPSQLERDFVRLFAMTPREFLNKVRVEHAITLLEKEEGSIAEVAYKSGYADHSAFTRRFRAAIGMTPRAYRALARSESDAE